RERGGAAAPTHARRGTLQGGTVLLPLRLFLGGAFLVEGLRKLYAPGFLDPSSSESFGHRIGVLREGSLSPSVMDLAANHAIGAGLLFAFGQVVVGFAVVLGLWTRLAGLAGMLLSLGVLIAVGSGSSPYHAPYVVFLAAFSPLALAGAPMYSADAWLSLRTWRGPIVTPVRARRRKLGYGSMLAFSGIGATLLAGSLLGGSHRHVDESDTGRVGSTLQPAAPGSAAVSTGQQSAAVATQPRPPVTEPSAPQPAKATGQAGPVAPRTATTAPGRSAAPSAKATTTQTSPTPEKQTSDKQTFEKRTPPPAHPMNGKAPASAPGIDPPAGPFGSGARPSLPKGGDTTGKPLGGLLG
ncbi:TQO small subunit DoxD, partial [Streptomyces sp. SID3343]|uniref:TQO small subunit DoxD n=1 Tax=Streptomyces sp. SID3343 TaxID=2690260 RepID=UPI0013711A4B